MANDPDAHRELPLDPDTPPRAAQLRTSSVAWVFLGGALGTWVRDELSQALPVAQWPWGTFVANLAGAFVLGALLETLSRCGPDEGRRQRLRLLAGTGFCGGLTTYSTLATETDLLARANATGTALGYLAATIVAGAALTWAGIAVATARSGR